MSKKLLVIGIISVLVVAFLVWLFMASSKPVPGQEQADLGRKHVTVGSLKDASGDLATSGDHYEDWVRAGIYETPRDDGYLIHSLEHGYVVISYNCGSAVQDNKEATSSAESTAAANLSEDCQKLIDQLKQVFEKKGKRKLIIVPRPQMETKITLYAWNYLLKLDQFDEEKITQFIDAYRDQGPERTAE